MSADFSTDALSTDTDITDRFELDNGQRDNFYDVGRIKLKTGALVPTGRLLITFDYFTHGVVIILMLTLIQVLLTMMLFQNTYQIQQVNNMS